MVIWKKRFLLFRQGFWSGKRKNYYESNHQHETKQAQDLLITSYFIMSNFFEETTSSYVEAAIPEEAEKSLTLSLEENIEENPKQKPSKSFNHLSYSQTYLYHP